MKGQVSLAISQTARDTEQHWERGSGGKLIVECKHLRFALRKAVLLIAEDKELWIFRDIKQDVSDDKVQDKLERGMIGK